MASYRPTITAQYLLSMRMMDSIVFWYLGAPLDMELLSAESLELPTIKTFTSAAVKKPICIWTMNKRHTTKRTLSERIERDRYKALVIRLTPETCCNLGPTFRQVREIHSGSRSDTQPSEPFKQLINYCGCQVSRNR